MPTKSAQPSAKNPLARTFKADGRQVARRSRRLQILALAILAVFLILAFYEAHAAGLLTSPGLSMAAFVAVWAAMLAIMFTLPFAAYFWHALRVYRPAFELLEWFADDGRRSRLAFDGNGQVPADLAAVLERIGDRIGDQASYFRVRALQEQGKLHEAETALEE